MIRSLCSIALTCLFCSAAQALPIVALQQSDDSTLYAASNTAGMAQSFVATTDNLTGAGVYLHHWSASAGSADITLSLWDALPDDGGTSLASATASGQRGNWVDVLWNPVATSVGQSYFLLIEGNNSLMTIASSGTSNPYPEGDAYANGYYIDTYRDFTFRTFYDDAFKDGGGFKMSAPATLPLLAAALLIGLRRRS